MQVQQLMTPVPRTCGPDTNVCTAVQMMWEGDFGALPVTDESGHVIGILTDRDIAIAVGTRNAAPAGLPVSSVMSGSVQTCRPQDEAATALTLMRERSVRRLPVVDAEDRLCGMISLDDAVLAANAGVPSTDIVETYRSICTHREATKDPLVVAA